MTSPTKVEFRTSGNHAANGLPRRVEKETGKECANTLIVRSDVHHIVSENLKKAVCELREDMSGIIASHHKDLTRQMEDQFSCLREEVLWAVAELRAAESANNVRQASKTSAPAPLGCLACDDQGCSLCKTSPCDNINTDNLTSPGSQLEKQTPNSSSKASLPSPANHTATTKRPSISSGAMKRQQTQRALEDDRASKTMRKIKSLVANPRFAHVFGVLIVVNSICIGLQTDFSAKNLDAEVPSVFTELETFFCFAFLLELVLKILAEQKAFFTNVAWKWNVFDSVIVFFALVEEVSKVASTGADSMNLTFFRILRILRIGRISRLIRVLKVFKELRVLMNSILGSVRSLCWTILLLIVFMYVLSIFVTQIAAEHRKAYYLAEVQGAQVDEKHAEDLENMTRMYGTVASTLYTLFKAMSGGADWGDVAQPLEDRVHLIFAPFFCIYIAFAVFAVLNVVTGVFVNEATLMASKDQELIIEDELSRTDSDINEFIRMFHEADADGSGSVSWDEFSAHLEDERVKAYFKVLDLNIDEAEQLFLLLDPQKTGEVSIDDFVKGCVRMKGGAKSVDIQTLLWQNKAILDVLSRLQVSMTRKNSR